MEGTAQEPNKGPTVQKDCAQRPDKGAVTYGVYAGGDADDVTPQDECAEENAQGGSTSQQMDPAMDTTQHVPNEGEMAQLPDAGVKKEDACAEGRAATGVTGCAAAAPQVGGAGETGLNTQNSDECSRKRTANMAWVGTETAPTEDIPQVLICLLYTSPSPRD